MIDKSLAIFESRKIHRYYDESIELWYFSIVYVIAALEAAPEIAEIDINPLIANDKTITAVDARINIIK